MAFAFLFMIGILGRLEHEVPPGFLVSLLLFLGGYSLSAILTASGLVRAYRSGMRVWVGQGVNQARTLLLGMLIMVFAVAVLGPICFWLAVGIPHAGTATMASLGLLVDIYGLISSAPWACCSFSTGSAGTSSPTGRASSGPRSRP